LKKEYSRHHRHDPDCRSNNNIKNKNAASRKNYASEGKGSHLMENTPQLQSKITTTTATTTRMNTKGRIANTSNRLHHHIMTTTSDIENKVPQEDDNHDDNDDNDDNKNVDFALALGGRDDFVRQDNNLGWM